DAHSSSGEDKFLAEGVAAAVVEDDRRDDVRVLALGSGDAVENAPVFDVEVSERGESRETPDQQSGEHRARHGEEAEARAASHQRRRPRIFASAASRMKGKATLETTSSESAT